MGQFCWKPCHWAAPRLLNYAVKVWCWSCNANIASFLSFQFSFRQHLNWNMDVETRRIMTVGHSCPKGWPMSSFLIASCVSPSSMFCPPSRVAGPAGFGHSLPEVDCLHTSICWLAMTSSFVSVSCYIIFD